MDSHAAVERIRFLEDIIEDLMHQSCVNDSQAISVYAQAFRTLAEAGRCHIRQECGRRVLVDWIPPADRNTLPQIEPKSVRQILVLRKDLGMRKGKMVAQGAHASQLALSMAISGDTPNGWTWHLAWIRDHYTKICVSVDSEAALLDLQQQAIAAALPCALVQDLGFTEFHGEKTYTALGIGPAPTELLQPITGTLPLL